VRVDIESFWMNNEFSFNVIPMMNGITLM